MSQLETEGKGAPQAAPTTATADEVGVSGERGPPLVNSVRSLQSRVSNLLAAGLMIALGVGALSWYYANALGRQKRMQQAAVASVSNNAQGEMPLPPLGTSEPEGSTRIGHGVIPGAAASAPGALPTANPLGDYPRTTSVSGAAPGIGAPPSDSDPPPGQARPHWDAGAMQPYGVTSVSPYSAPYGAADPYHPAQPQSVSDRRLSGVAFSREATQSSPSVATTGQVGLDPSAFAGNRIPAAQGASPSETDEGLGKLLRPRVTAPARAQLLPTQQLLLPKGAFIDCTLETAIDSTLPGMTTCVTATDTFGVDGKVVLLERGSKLVGETRGEVQNGAARVFVLWTEARTPTGVLVPLDSPGTDELGRSGLPGEVNRHFWDRFGAAMLVSVINGVMQAAVQSASHGGGGIIYNPSTSQEALTDVLKGTINIAPTVIKHQGDRIQILVARDLDFRPVYELRTAGF